MNDKNTKENLGQDDFSYQEVEMNEDSNLDNSNPLDDYRKQKIVLGIIIIIILVVLFIYFRS
jgi:hypothetical protein